MKKPYLTSWTKGIRISLAALFLCLPAANQARAGNDTWTGGGAPDGNWQNANNWGGTAPLAGDSLFFDSGNQTAATNNFANGTIFGSLSFNSGAGAFTLSPVSGGDGSGIVLTNQSVDANNNLFGGSVSNYSAGLEIIAFPLALSAGNHIVATVSGAGALDISGAFTRNTGATAQFFVGGGSVNYTSAGLANVNGILGGWAVIGPGSNLGDWAALDGSQNVVAYSGYTTKSGGSNMGLSSSGGNAGSNIKINTRSSTANTLNSSTAGTYDINSLVWNIGNSNPSGDQTLTISSSQIMRLGANGAVMSVHSGSRTFNVGSGNTTSSGISAGGAANTAGELSFYSVPFNNGSARLNVNAPILDNGSGKVSVNVYGGMTFAQAGTFSGGTYVNTGYVWANNAGSFGTGPVYVSPGSEVILNKSGGTYGNNFFIAGFGGILDPIAFRDSSGATLTGTITLLGTAAVAASGSSTTLNGPVTGAGGLYVIGSYANASLHLGESAANTYAGDTTIDAAGIGNDTGHNITIWVNNSTHNNILPGGSGAGNLILNGGGSALAQLDLGGTTQTINGLISSGNAAEALVTSNPGGGTLAAGANNNSSEYDGVIGTSGGQGTANVNLTKLGTGTLTLGGVNNYTGNTTISNGVLALSGSGSISASTNIYVAGPATFDVSQASFTLATGQSLSGSGVVTGLVNTASGSIINAGTNSSALTFTNGLTLNAGATVACQLAATPAGGAIGKIAVGGSAFTLSGGTISVTYATLQAGRYKLMAYTGGKSGSAANNLVLLCAPSGNLTGALDDSIPGEIDLVVTAGLVSLVWKGDNSQNTWDVNSTSNWLNGANGYLFTNGDAVTFNDTGSKSPAVNLSGALQPLSILVSNNTGAYTFAGGSISGGATLTKSGSGTLVLTESGDTFVGGINVSNGTLVVDNDSSGVAGGVNVSTGGTLQLGNADGLGVLPSGTINANGTLVLNHPDDIVVGNVISGGGTFIKTNLGAVALTAVNSFTGNISIPGGALRGWTQATLGTTNGTITVADGATLDHGWDTTKAIVVAGTGVGGAGAIVNNSTGNAIYDGAGGGLTASLTLTGDTTFGGNTRWDLGYPCLLSTGGSNYNLTIDESDGTYMEWENVTIDTNLGNIDISTGVGGSLGIKGCGASLGNPTNTITVHPNAALTFWGFGTNDSGYAKNIHVLSGGSVNFRPQTTNVYYNTALTLEDGANWAMFNGGGAIGTVVLQPVQLNGLVHLEVGDSTCTISNVISGPGGFYWDNFNNTLAFTAVNTYQGVTDIRAGRTLALRGVGSILQSSNILLAVGATLNASGRADQTLTLANGQVLQTGTIGSAAVTGNLTAGAGSVVLPGGDGLTGTLTVSSNVVLQGTVSMDLDLLGATNDVLAGGASGSITYGGTLILANITGDFADGQSFKLFNAGSYSGAFAAILPASPGAGLVWNTNNLTTTGTLGVVSPTKPRPTITSFGVSGTTLLLSATNGGVSGAFVLLASTNAALPLAQWTPVLTNAFDSNGNLNLTTNIINPAAKQEFYILSQ